MNDMTLDFSSPIKHRRAAAWGDIGIVHYLFGAGELPEHRNDEHLIALSLSENCQGEIRTSSGFRTRHHNRGSVCVIPAGTNYSASLKGESEHLAIRLDTGLLSRTAAEMNLKGAVEIVETCVETDSVVNSVGRALLDELDSAGPGGRLYAESLANILAVHLLRYYTEPGVKTRRFTGGLSGRKLQNVLELINQRYAEDLSLVELAAAAEMSAFHFAREFKRATATTPHQYLLRVRIERAKELLATGKAPLVEVGLQSGFSHQSHFTRLFRKLTGTTPHSYRLRFQT